MPPEVLAGTAIGIGEAGNATLLIATKLFEGDAFQTMLYVVGTPVVAL